MIRQHHFDLFLSYSSEDKAVVRDLADRLKQRGLKVWFDEWMIAPDDNIAITVEEGLKHSRVLVLCMSENTYDSQWAQLEARTFRFRDPLDSERRFIPLCLDYTPVHSSLAHFSTLSWLRAERKKTLATLDDICRGARPRRTRGRTRRRGKLAVKASQIPFVKYQEPNCLSLNRDGVLVASGGHDKAIRIHDVATGNCSVLLSGHSGLVTCLSWSDDGNHLLSGGDDSTIKLWDVASGICVRAFEGHAASVSSVAWSSQQRRFLSTSADATVRLWDADTGECIRQLRGHTNSVQGVSLAGDQRRALTSSTDGTVRLWDVETGLCLRILEGHTLAVGSVVWSPDQQHALSGSRDRTIRHWDVNTGQCLHILDGHEGGVLCLAFHADGVRALSGSTDRTVRLWDLETGDCLRHFEGHEGVVQGVVWKSRHHRAVSCDSIGGIREWDLKRFFPIVDSGHSLQRTTLAVPQQVRYTNAKVLLVGDSGVGKSGLSNYLAHNVKVEDNRPLPSTDGAWATRWPLPNTDLHSGVERDVWLWDFAGQVDYRLVHQLYMDEAAVAVLVLNPQTENPFEGLGHWDRDLQKAARRPFAKLLAAGRIDCGRLVVSTSSMTTFMSERGYLPPLHLTSAKTGEGCDDLRNAIVAAIDWESLPETTSPALYRFIKQEILTLRDSGLVLIRLAELNQRVQMSLRGRGFTPPELMAVVRLLSGPGMIQSLDFGGFILLRPEVLSRYAASVVRKVRMHPQEMGCIREDELLDGDLDYQDFQRLPREDESVVLRALLETFVTRAWCLRQPCDGTSVLTFPSYFRRERREQPSHPSVLVSYRFSGPLDDIYATLVVRLHHTMAFTSTDLWKAAADFITQSGAALGFVCTRENEGAGRLDIYFQPDVDPNSRVLFLRYVHDHLLQHAQEVVRLRHYSCAHRNCKRHHLAFADRQAIDEALMVGGLKKVFCPGCGKPIVLNDAIEDMFESADVKERARDLDSEAQVVIDNESRELMAVHHTGFIVAEAGQIYRGYTNSDHGIDGEIEFKDKDGRASGRRLYMQLKSGDSYLKKRRRDGAEVFQIKNPRWASYWRKQAYPVMLVIRTSDGEIRWMDVSDYLKNEIAGGMRPRSVVFDGERFDVMSVRRWRDALLKGS